MQHRQRSHQLRVDDHDDHDADDEHDDVGNDTAILRSCTAITSSVIVPRHSFHAFLPILYYCIYLTRDISKLAATQSREHRSPPANLPLTIIDTNMSSLFLSLKREIQDLPPVLVFFPSSCPFFYPVLHGSNNYRATPKYPREYVETRSCYIVAEYNGKRPILSASIHS